MAEFEYGPVDLYLVGFEGDRPDPGTLDAIGELIEGGEIRLLDFLVISHEEDGSVLVTDFEEVRDEYGFGTGDLEASGLVGDEDVEDLADLIPARHVRRVARHRTRVGEAARLEVRRLGRGRPADRAHSGAGRQRCTGRS